jgi:hypothetical protein
MNREIYPVINDVSMMHHTFFSVGPKGVIRKAVQFVKIADDFFNLSFGDWNDSLEKIDDSVRSDNRDGDKVLATVASVVLTFFKQFPNAHVYAKGSTPSRTRLYQMGINANLDFINKFLDMYGYVDGEWKVFENYKNYSAFQVRSKPIF